MNFLSSYSGKSSLKVREHKSLGPYVENLSKLAVRSFKVSLNVLTSREKRPSLRSTSWSDFSGIMCAFNSCINSCSVLDIVICAF